jgi:malonyl-CoA/methylmalonyl-CoA synthetase
MTPGIVERAAQWPNRIAVIDGDGPHTYGQLLDASGRLARLLLGDRPDLAEARVAFMVEPGFAYVAWQWAIWRAGGIAVPLCLTHPAPELAYVLDDAGADTVVAGAGFEAVLGPLADERGLPLLSKDADTGPPGAWHPADGAVVPDHAVPTDRDLPRVRPERRAMMLYTSGTTGRPKGVVTTHAAIEAQVRSLVNAWGWTADDRILLVLPLHHVHGIVNVVGCALWSGAACEMLPRFDAGTTWNRLRSSPLTLFMAVPTTYHRLIDAWERAEEDDRTAMTAGCRRMRLMVSGSAALPVPTLEAWERISGHVLLERYGMTEIGMGLSNPLNGTRVPGHVGSPLPGVEVRLVDETGTPVGDGIPGEIQVRGPTLFSEYWGRPDATAEAFVDGWFRTGDVAVRTDGIYRILGRASVDIIKTGGEKVSALEIEEVLLRHPAIREAAVVGVPDPDWGERVVAVVVAARGTAVSEDELRAWCRASLAPYKVPKDVHLRESLPRNAMGKVTKPELAASLGAGRGR